METDKRVFNDPIHGSIELHPLCCKIIDTPQFQRLRFIKQLGGVYFVYPGAAHNRFEHSIGVCHLAGQLVRALKSRQPTAFGDIKEQKVDELCVEIAALCHDLGHGPFSHVFDTKVVPKLRSEEWKHEKGSVAMLRHMLKANPELSKEFENAEINKKKQLFIEELIAGSKPSNEGKYKDMPDNLFLYEIVSNSRNSIDVDKWDYFARDCHMLGIGNNFNFKRCIAFSRVIAVNGETQICYRNKEAANLYDMFHTRYLLHYRAYQHKTSNSIELMIAEALILANDHIKLPGSGKECTMSEAIDDMEAYSFLTDDVIYCILREQSTEDKKKLEKKKKELEDAKSTEDNKKLEEKKKELEDAKSTEEIKKLEVKIKKLEDAKRIIRRVLSRDLYQFVVEERYEYKTFANADDVEKDINNFLQTHDEVKKDIIEFVQTDASSKFKDRSCQSCMNLKETTFIFDTQDAIKINDNRQGVTEYFSRAQLAQSARDELKKDIIEFEQTHEDLEAKTLKCLDQCLVIDLVKFNYGMKDQNPIDEVNFYTKNKPDEAVPISKDYVSLLLPGKFAEQLVRVYCKDKRFNSIVNVLFEKWRQNRKTQAQ